MVAFRIISCVLLIIFTIFEVLTVLLVVVAVLMIEHNANEKGDGDVRKGQTEDPNIGLLAAEMSSIRAIFEVAIPLAVNIYFFVCINSLYHEVEELNTTQIPGDNIFTLQQVIKIDNRHEQSPPYNPALQPCCSTQVIVPMQSIYPDVSKFKSETV